MISQQNNSKLWNFSELQCFPQGFAFIFFCTDSSCTDSPFGMISSLLSCTLSSSFLFLHSCFNWLIAALQCCIVSAVQQQEPAISIPLPCGPSSPSLPSHPARPVESPGLGSLCYIAAFYSLFYTSIACTFIYCASLSLIVVARESAESVWTGYAYGRSDKRTAILHEIQIPNLFRMYGRSSGHSTTAFLPIGLIPEGLPNSPTQAPDEK